MGDFAKHFGHLVMWRKNKLKNRLIFHLHSVLTSSALLICCSSQIPSVYMLLCYCENMAIIFSTKSADMNKTTVSMLVSVNM